MTVVPPLRFKTIAETPFLQSALTQLSQWVDEARNKLLNTPFFDVRDFVANADGFPLNIRVAKPSPPLGMFLIDCRRDDGTAETTTKVITGWTWSGDGQVTLQSISNLTATFDYRVTLVALWRD